MAEEPDLLAQLRSLGEPDEPARDYRADLDALDDAQDDEPVGVSETARRLESEGYFESLGLQQSLDRSAAESNANAKSAGARGVLGDSFGTLDQAGQQDWLRETSESLRAERGNLDALSARVSAGRQRLSRWFGEDYVSNLEAVGSLAGPSVLESADKDLVRREREQRERLAGTRPLASKTALRSAVENVPQGLADLAAGIVKGVGIGAGFVGRDVIGADMAPDDNTVHSLGKWVEAKGRELFPGDQARQEEFAQKLAHGAGSMVGFYGPAVVGHLLNATPKVLMGITMASGALAEGSETYEQGMHSLQAGREVSEGQLALAYTLGMALGTSEALPVAAMFKGGRGGLIRGMGVQAIEEGGQEGFQTFGENAIARLLHDPERELGKDVAENSAIGFILGAFMQGARYAASKDARQSAHEGEAANCISGSWIAARSSVIATRRPR